MKLYKRHRPHLALEPRGGHDGTGSSSLSPVIYLSTTHPCTMFHVGFVSDNSGGGNIIKTIFEGSRHKRGAENVLRVTLRLPLWWHGIYARKLSTFTLLVPSMTELFLWETHLKCHCVGTRVCAPHLPPFNTPVACRENMQSWGKWLMTSKCVYY